MHHEHGESNGFSLGLEFDKGFSNPFESIIHQTYEPGSMNLFMDLPSYHKHGHRDLPGLEISFGDPFHSHMERSVSGKCAAEVMNTLDRHAIFMNVGKDQEHITRKELENYLKREGRHLDPQDRADLTKVLVNFDNIAAADGRSRGKGISSRDVDAVMLHEERRERLHNAYGGMFESLHMQLREMQEELAALRGEGNWNNPNRRNDKPHDHGNKRNDAPPNPNDRVITEKQANGHYAIEGQDMPLSQEEFKKHYGIPMEIDLQKYMPGKANDGKVVPFWESPVTVGLGGRLENGNLKWEDPNYHTLKYDFSRNFAQVFEFTKGMNEDQQKEFAFNFARTQQGVFAANGFDLHKVDNEKVYASGEGTEGWTDFVADIGGTNPRINW